MSSKNVSTEEKVAVLEQYFKDKNLEIDLIYYQVCDDKCVVSSTFYLPDNTLAIDLKVMGTTIDEYNTYSPDKKSDISTKIFTKHMKAEYDLISTFNNTTLDITEPYKIRYHSGRININKVYDIMPKSKKTNKITWKK